MRIVKLLLCVKVVSRHAVRHTTQNSNNFGTNSQYISFELSVEK